MRWNVETIGFSPNGFNAYFVFKVLIVAFCIMVMIQSVEVFWRAYLEWLEGEDSEGRYLDRDKTGDIDEDVEHMIHTGST